MTNSIAGECEEEILVLKSIFNEDFIENSSYEFDLIIRFDSLPNKLRLIHEELNTEISHLPPITLRVKYKTIYPPDYSISCDYLTSDQLLSIVEQMDSMVTPGEVIVFNWIELIKDYFYQMNNQLILLSIESSRNDRRFTTNYDQIGAKRIYEQLMEYDRMQTQVEFDQTYHSCPICLDDKLGKNCFQFEKCRHYACMPCVNSYAKESLLNIQEKQQITCYQCDTNLNLSEIRRIFSDEKLFMKYQQHFIDMISCPRCHKSIVCIPSESQSGNHQSFAECLYCCFTFCRRCEESWHPQVQCPKEKIVQEIMKNPSENRPQLNKIDLNKLLLEIETIQAIEQCSKPCPSCSVRIEKNGGCQHMHCRACQIHFCWTCGWFGPSYAPHPCTPKPVVTAVALPHEIQEKILVDENGKIIQSDKIKRVQICPRPFCREVHVKIGTKNMILCSKCEKHFCFLCGEAIYGLFHYSEYGCKVDTKV